MIQMTRKTRLGSEAVIDRAASFFGEKGLGLKATERNPCCISFEGGGGYISVTVSTAGGESEVNIEAREWEYQVRAFLQNL